MNETTVRLLWAAAGLLLISGCIFAFLTLWRYAALMGVGALGCAVALGISNRAKRIEPPRYEALIAKERKLFYHRGRKEPRTGAFRPLFGALA